MFSGLIEKLQRRQDLTTEEASRAMDEILGTRASGLRLLMKANFRPAWAVMPAGEAMVLWLRNNLAAEADKILDCAREHYRNLAQCSRAA